MPKHFQSCLYYAFTLGLLWQQPSTLFASQNLNEGSQERKVSLLLRRDTSSLLHAPLLTNDNDPLPSIKSIQQDLQGSILKSLQARPDSLTPLVAQMKEVLASLSDTSKKALKQREAFLLEPSLSAYSPLGFLRRKEKLLTGINLSPQHFSFERLREVIAHLENLCENEDSIISPSLKTSLLKLKSIYENFIADLYSASVDKRSILLSAVPIDGEFFEAPFVISQEQAYDLLSFDEYGIPIKNNALGSSVVTQVGAIHAKSTLIKANQQGTLDPGIEWAVSTFHHLLFGEGMVPSSLLILRDVSHQEALPHTEAERIVSEAKNSNTARMDKKKILNRLHEDESLKNQFQRTTQSFAVQVTPHIEGIHLSTFLAQALQEPSLWDTLDPYNVQSLLLTALLTAPNDAKGDNFMVIKEESTKDDGSPSIRHKIIGIDNDRAFYPYVSASNPHNHYLDIFHILFFYPQVMRAPLIQHVKDQFLSYHPVLFLLNWLKALDHHNDKYQQLLTQGRLSQQTFDTLHLPFKFRSGSVSALLKRFMIVHQELTLNKNSEITVAQLLKALSPLASACCEVLPQKILPEDLFHKVKNNNLERLIKEELEKDKELQKAFMEEQEDGTTLHIREQPLQEAILEVLDTFELQALTPPIRKQVIEEAFLSHPKLLAQTQHPQWQSPYIVHEGLKHKEASSLLIKSNTNMPLSSLENLPPVGKVELKLTDLKEPGRLLETLPVLNQHKETLKKLDLERNQLGGTKINILAPTLGNLTNLTDLNLRDNKIGLGGIVGITSLTSALMNLTKLTKLNFEFNQLGDQGITVLSPALVTLTNLTELYLVDDNRIGDIGVKVLIPVIEKLIKLKHFSLGWSYLVEESNVINLGNTLQNLPNLTLYHFANELEAPQSKWDPKLAILMEKLDNKKITFVTSNGILSKAKN